MYDAYFGFAESPFENNLDQRFLFLSEGHKEVLGALLYFVKAKKSFAMVCGDVGTGKTMLLNFFLQRLPESVHPVIVSNPYLSSQDLLLHLAETLKIGKVEKKGLLHLTDKVKEALVKVRDKDQQLVLIVDEAHLLSDQALEEIRLLSNLETHKEKLLQILLVGQYELSYKLDRPEMRHLRQRININRFLSPMNSSETVQYIDYRLKQVGSSFASVFAPNSENLLFRMTKGVPRRINQICDNALLIAMADELKKVSLKILKKAEEAVQTDLILTPKSSRGWGGLFEKSFSLRSAVAAITVVLLVVIIAFKGDLWMKKLQALSYKNQGLTETVPEKKFSHTAPSQMADSSKREPLPLQVVQKSERQDPGLHKPPPGLTARREHVASAAMASLELSQPSEGTSASPPSRELYFPLKAGVFNNPIRLTAKGGETLTRLAGNYYSKNKKLGLVAIILANPEITDENLIYKGRGLDLPAINFPNQTIRLKDGFFYALYGWYNSSASLEKMASSLGQKKIRFLVRDTRDARGHEIYRIFLGGYDTEADLVRTLKDLTQRESLALQVEQKFERQAPDLRKPLPGLTARGEHVASAAAASSVVTHPSEDSSASPPPKELLSPPYAGVPNNPIRLTAKSGETLTRLTAHYYSENRKLGLVAIILANTEITDENLIYKGQGLDLPTINFANQTIRLKDGRFYALYGWYNSSGSFEKMASYLGKKKIRFLVRDTRDKGGNETYRIFLGGYDTEADLVRTLKDLKMQEDELALGD